MRKKTDRKPVAGHETLRARAEVILRHSATDVRRMSAEEIQRLVHDLQVHQIELQMQNEELRRAQMELAQTRDSFNDLYDSAPVAYLTLDAGALILEANLIAATLFGLERRGLVGKPFFRWVAPQSRGVFYQHQRALLGSTAKQTCDLLLRRVDGLVFPAQLITLSTADAATHTRAYRCVISDITERKQRESEFQRQAAALQKSVEELQRFNRAAVGRELRMIELKKEINALCAAAGQPPRYPSKFARRAEH
jgi:PAS domain S-box-containing protein